MTSTSSPRTKRPRFVLWFVICGFVVTVFVALTPLIVESIVGTDSVVRGTFGDQFGALNALFSGLAFAGVIVAIIMQSAELRLQQEELADTRQVLDRQREQMEAQAKALARQTFETTLFAMIGLHHEIVANTTTNVSRVDAHGRAAFGDMARFVRGSLHKETRDDPKPQGDSARAARINHHYQKCYREWLYISIGHYFRHLYRMFVFIESSAVEDKESYAKIVRAQLSDDELFLLFYNCVSTFGDKQFRLLAEKYNLFDNLRVTLLVDPTDRCLTKSSMED